MVAAANLVEVAALVRNNVARAAQAARELDGCTAGSPEEAEYINVVEAIEAYEAERWPEGHIPGGKG